jgi:uncharacterized membrane protein HdeD (DUF308 family)
MDSPTTPVPGPFRTVIAAEVETLRNHWKWFLALGIGMVVLGTISLGCAVFTTEVAVVAFGFLMLAGGMAEIISAFWAGKWSGTLIHLVIGILYTLVGMMIVHNPVGGAIQLTLLLAFFLIFSGILRIVFALSEQFSGWGWVLLNGAVTLMLGMLIYKGWPSSAFWVIGLFIGIELIFNGWAWVMLSLTLKPREVTKAA